VYIRATLWRKEGFEKTFESKVCYMQKRFAILYTKKHPVKGAKYQLNQNYHLQLY